MSDKIPLSSEELIRRAERRDRDSRGVGLIVLLLLTFINIYGLIQIHNTQEQIAASTRAANAQQKELLDQANNNAEANHAEIIRYLRCIALLIPPYTGDSRQLDNCIATSKLPDSQQNPPISIPNSTQSNAASNEPTAVTRSDTGQVTPSTAAQPTPSSPAPSQSSTPAPAQQTHPVMNIVNSVLKQFGL